MQINSDSWKIDSGQVPVDWLAAKLTP